MKTNRDWAIERLGPREVGGRYYSGYWQREYTVTDIAWLDDDIWEIEIVWQDRPRRYRHWTAWDPKRDRVLASPQQSSSQLTAS